MDDIAVGILRAARNAGFQIDMAGESLQVTGPQDRRDIIQQIREHKQEIVAALGEPPRGVSHYTDRLSNGLEWLSACYNKLAGVGPMAEGHEAMVDAFARNLDRWYNLETELRRVYPEYRGCPVGGCERHAIVRCLHCATPTTENPES